MGSKSKSSLAFSLVCVFLTVFHLGHVYPKPLTSSEGESGTLPLDNILAASGSEVNSSADNPTSGHAFIKVETLNDRSTIPAGASIAVQGDSSLRLFKDTDINHPSFDPSKFLMLATNDSVQSVEVYPVSNQPYFMFVPPELLKNQTLTSALFGNMKKRRIKRHHPGVLQNVLGELQNFALVPIKSPNGQIRYILLKNPKFVIGNPTDGQSGQAAPTIIQLNSNNLPVDLPGGQVRYTPKVPTEPITVPTFRNNMLNRQQPSVPVAVPVAKPIDSIFTSRNTAIDRSSIKSSKTTEKRTSVTSSKRLGTKTIPNIPSTWKELKRNIGVNKNVATPVAETKKVSVKKETKSVTADKVKSSVGSVKESANGVKASVANATLSKTEENVTNVDQTNTKNITVTKVGDKHKIEQTEIIETVVDVKKNETAEKTHEAASKVVSTDSGHSSSGNDNKNSVLANSGASEKATAEKQAQVVKKTKKTTTILLKSASETKSGKAEISEIQHTVEELVHHNTSEVNAAETAASAKVDVAASDTHGHSHGHSHEHSHGHSSEPSHGHAHDHSHTHVNSENTSAAENKKATNSTSTSVKTTSVKQTVIKKKVPDANAGNSTVSSEAVSGTVDKSTGGFDVKHVEHVIKETEHKTVDVASSDTHGHSHTHSHEHSGDHTHGHAHDHSHTHVNSENAANAETKKATNSTSTSVKTKSVKQTVITKKIPDTKTGNSTELTEALSGTGNKPTGGFDVQHVEHVIQETEHKTVDLSQTTNQKASASSANDVHHH